MSRKGAAMRIGTVPAVIMIGSIAARTNQTRAERRPSVTPIAEPSKGERRRRPEIGHGPLQYGQWSWQNDRRDYQCRRLPQRDEQNGSRKTTRIKRRERPHRRAKPG